jgi:hypothetical protein
VLGGVDGSLHLTVPSLNRLNQTEPATFSILPRWAFFRDSYFLYFTDHMHWHHFAFRHFKLYTLPDTKCDNLFVILKFWLIKTVFPSKWLHNVSKMTLIMQTFHVTWRYLSYHRSTCVMTHFTQNKLHELHLRMFLNSKFHHFSV